jgi:broad specificity phosphatase PhoE
MRLFLLARHGQSLFNVDKVVNGDPALDRGLSEQGIEEAELLGGQLAALPVDLVAVSPFPRALQTANIALAGRDVPHLVDEELGDVRIGELEGHSLDDYRATPAHSNRKERFPGGESLDEAALRYAGVCERLLARSEAVTLVVCHEIPVRYLANAAAGSEELNGPLRFVANATPYLFDEASLRRAVARTRHLAG